MVQARNNAVLNGAMAMGMKKEVAALSHGDFDGIMSYF